MIYASIFNQGEVFTKFIKFKNIWIWWTSNHKLESEDGNVQLETIISKELIIADIWVVVFAICENPLTWSFLLSELLELGAETGVEGGGVLTIKEHE